jgi:hypothetical protein
LFWFERHSFSPSAAVFQSSRFFWLNTHFQRSCCAEEVIPNERHERRFGFFLLMRDPAVSVDGYATPVAIALDLDCSHRFIHCSFT